MIAYNLIQYLMIVLLGTASLYILVFAVAGLFYRQKPYLNTVGYKKIAVLIPGYKEDEVIIDAAKNALQQNYPTDVFDVIVIADSLKKETLSNLNALPIKLVEVSFEASTKSKALNRAMETLPVNYDLVVILDADNQMEDDFLMKINAAFVESCCAIQGHRVAKNVNNSWAILDAISEEINNHIFRKGHRVFGLSSAIIGSGMAFRYDYFEAMMKSVTAVGGFDKEIELKMLRRGEKIIYLDDAYVYDEKVQESEVFSNQRRRWLSAQYHYFRKGIMDSCKELIRNGNIDYFDKAIQFLLPPRVLLLGSVFLFGFMFIVGNSILNAGYQLTVTWISIIAGCVMALLISVPRTFFNLRTLKALAGLPKGMFLMLVSLMRIKGANKKFIHTKHGSVPANIR